MAGYDVAIVGGGIVGLATGRRLLQEHPDLSLVLLEKEDRLSTHQTGRNSGVIHSGIYYRPGSQKALLCVEGAREMVRFCKDEGVPYDCCGKVIVATDESEVPRLHALHRRGTENGVPGLEIIGPERVRELEPHARAVQALYSPSTGIVDYKAVSAAMARSITQLGGEIQLGARVEAVSAGSNEVVLETGRGEVRARYLINCAGLFADVIARMAGADPGIRILPFRGEYYMLRPEASPLVNSLIYPVPNPEFPFLGVHFTKSVHGGVEAGPNAVLAFAREGYRKTQVDLADTLGALTFPGFWTMARKYWKTGAGEVYRSFSKAAFVRGLQRLVPEIRAEALTPREPGIRAQALDRRGNLLDDFAIHQTQNAVHVLNAPSPAATASLAIARHIVGLARDAFELPSPLRTRKLA